MTKLGVVCLILSANIAEAATPAASAASGDFDYPELLVTPRASERVATEASKEQSSRWIRQAPLQISALSTLVAGFVQISNPDLSKDPDKTSGIAGMVVGGTWLATTLALEAFYEPYTSATREISAMPSKTPREQLVRERAAEEAIHSAARLGWQLRWLSVLTNLGANAYMITKAQPNSFSQIMDGVAAGLSLAPLIFCDHWTHVSQEQESYKKRIYAPIARATLMTEPGTGNLAPGAFISMRF